MDQDYRDSSPDDDSLDENDLRGLEVTRSPLQEDLLPLLECPVCFDLPLPPILTCYQGHIICANCCPKLQSKRCPLCQKPIGCGRNFFAEDYINRSTMNCKYKSDGCQATFTGAEAKAHITQCEFRPLKCLHCAKKVPFGEYEYHLWNTHKISRWDITENGSRIYDIEKKRKFHGPLLNHDAITSSVATSILLVSAVTAFSFFSDYALAYFSDSLDA